MFEKQAYLNNHLYITVRYHPVERYSSLCSCLTIEYVTYSTLSLSSQGGLAYRIVGFEVEPQSFAEDDMTVVSLEGGVKKCGRAKEGDTKRLAIKRGS